MIKSILTGRGRYLEMNRTVRNERLGNWIKERAGVGKT
jgi:hypothetical protein